MSRKTFNSRASYQQFIGFSFLYFTIIVAVLTLGAIIYFISVNGIKVISWEFLTRVPRRAMTQGGIAPALVGTFYLTVGAILFALPMGLACAIFLTEYSPKNIIVNILRMSINNLAGVPSVVFGLFGLTIYVKYLGFGVSILSGSLTLGIMILPGIISAAQEALIAVPQSLREASLALGATQGKPISQDAPCRRATAGFITGVILSVGRAAAANARLCSRRQLLHAPVFPHSIFV
jgi:phosphate transport system permease protein